MYFSIFFKICFRKVNSYQNSGIFEKEDYLEFKSADDVLGKPTRFAKEKLLPTIKGYIENGKLKRYCIMYGIEDNGEIKPINHLKSDQITEIENIVNNNLTQDNIRISIQPVPFNAGIILCILITPVFSESEIK